MIVAPALTTPGADLAEVMVALALGDGEPLKDIPGIEEGRNVEPRMIWAERWKTVSIVA